MTFFFLPTLSLVQRELRRFYRQRSRIVGSLGTPVIFWVLLGTGLQAAFPGGGQGSFVQYFYPANLVMTLLFASIFSTISIIEDRHEGFLQSVLVAPVSPGAVVGGKVLGGALIGTFQGILFLCLSPFAGFSMGITGAAFALVSMFALSLTMTALGFIFAWRLDSVQGFHSIMNLLLFPMWLMSGSFFPLFKAPLWLKPIMYMNPLTYGVASLQQALHWDKGGIDTLSYPLGIAITLLFGIGFYLIAIRTFQRTDSVMV